MKHSVRRYIGVAALLLASFSGRADRLLWRTEIPFDWTLRDLDIFPRYYGVAVQVNGREPGDPNHYVWLSRDGKLIHRGDVASGWGVVALPGRMLFELTGTDKWMAWTAIAGGVTETQIQGTVGDLRIVRIDFNRYYKTQQYPGRGVVECWQIEPVAADPEEAGDPGGGRVPLAIESSTTATGPWKQVGTTSAPATSDAEFYRLRIER